MDISIEKDLELEVSKCVFRYEKVCLNVSDSFVDKLGRVNINAGIGESSSAYGPMALVVV